MTDKLPPETTLGSMLRSRPPKEQVVLIDRLLADPELALKARLPLPRLRSALIVDLIEEAKAEKARSHCDQNDLRSIET